MYGASWRRRRQRSHWGYEDDGRRSGERVGAEVREDDNSWVQIGHPSKRFNQSRLQHSWDESSRPFYVMS